MKNYSYLSTGKLFRSVNGGRPVELVSEFARQAQERLRKSLDRDHWKSSDADRGMTGYSVWNVSSRDSGRVMDCIQSVAAGKDPSSFYYVLRTESIGGLFRYLADEERELRIFHKEEMDLCDLHHHPEREEFVCSAADGFGRSIAILSNRSSDIDFVTEGDSDDCAPYWVPGQPDVIVYQSTGIGLDSHGDPVSARQATIEQLNTSSGNHSVLLDDPQFDYLNPQMDVEGNLYCIRRPHHPGGRRVSFKDTFVDVLFIPVRLVKAFVGFLDVMTRIFGNESLINASNGKRKSVDSKMAYIKGRAIDLSKSGEQDEERGSILPSDWELIKVAPSGETTVVEKKVGDFDLAADGSIICTNGKSLLRIDAEGATRMFKGDDIITQVKWV